MVISGEIHGATYLPIPMELYPRCHPDSMKFIPTISPVHTELASREASLHIFRRIALTVMWMQQYNSNYLCRSVGISARYCGRIVPIQVLEVQMVLRLVVGCLYADWRVSFTHEQWHPPVPLSLFVGQHVRTRTKWLQTSSIVLLFDGEVSVFSLFAR